MPVSYLQLFRTLAAFDPEPVQLGDAPWEAYVDWAIANGLAPLAAYNVEYRLGRCGAPQWARDRLMSVYQGTLNDNVMKLLNFKRSVDELEGRRVVLLSGAAFAEGLYPHVAFRPVIDIHLLVEKKDLDGLVGFLRGSEFKPPAEPPEDVPPADRMLSDGRTLLLLHGGLTGQAAEDEGLFARALPFKVYGPSMRRLVLEDALLAQVLLFARQGFDVPMLEWIDLRELVLGAPTVGGPFTRVPEAETLRARAKAWKLERALYAALSVLANLFPQTEAASRPFKPELNFAVREVLERALVAPLSEVGRPRSFKVQDEVFRLLTGA
jgi:Uncharacterised nucleotidyltransferase